jgi:hypothetical protein
MRKATREALTLAISANAAEVAWRSVNSIRVPSWWIRLERSARLHEARLEADRYWLRLANTLRGK